MGSVEGDIDRHCAEIHAYDVFIEWCENNGHDPGDPDTFDQWTYTQEREPDDDR